MARTTNTEKVYVAVGDDFQEGAMTLDWVLKKWSSSSAPVAIVILYSSHNLSNEFITTPFGMLQVSAVNGDGLNLLRELEEDESTDNMLSEYAALCGKAINVEIRRLSSFDQPVEKTILELIEELHITSLVVAMTTFMRPLTGSSGGAVSGSVFMHQNKPEFCQLYVISGGELVFLNGMNEECQVEGDDDTLGNQNPGIRWLGKDVGNESTAASSVSMVAVTSPLPWINKISRDSYSDKQWKMILQEIEDYFHRVLEESDQDVNDIEGNKAMDLESRFAEIDLSDTTKTEERIKALRMELEGTETIIQLKKEIAKTEVERQAKARWAIHLNKIMTKELERLIEEERVTRVHLDKQIDDITEQVYESSEDIKEGKNRLTSLREIQSELSYKLRISSSAKSQAESQLWIAAASRGKLVREIEELRKKRGILHRRIQFCKEKDAIRMATSGGGGNRTGDGGDCGSCSVFREFTGEDISLATNKFDVKRRLKRAGEWTNVYKGKINSAQVAIKILDSCALSSHENFRVKVNLLVDIRHPHIVPFIGFCTIPKCFVFEYMQNGCLRDILFCRRKSKMLQWHRRAHIASDICSALTFLHLSQPKPIIHGNLNPSSVLLDQHLVPKIDPSELRPCRLCTGTTVSNPEVRGDINAFGLLLLQLLCGRNWAQVDQESLMDDQQQMIFDALDDNAGEWPLDLATEIVTVAVKCLSVDSGSDPGLILNWVMKELNRIKRKADDYLTATGLREESQETIMELRVEEEGRASDNVNVPSVFVCPIFKEMMQNPHIAADGFSYELEAIQEWIELGNETSPVTNGRLDHRYLTPNHTLRSLIQDWESQRQSPLN